MAIYSIPVAKAKGNLDVDPERFNEDVYKAIFVEGMKVMLAKRMTKVTKELYPNPEELAAAALKIAQENLEALYAGKLSTRSAKASNKVPGVVMTEARRLAKQAVKDELKRRGEKISYYAASEITKFANAWIEQQPQFIEMAKENIAKREAAEAEIANSLDLSGMQVDPAKVKKAEADKAARKDQLSAAKAGKTAPRKRGEAQATAH